ALRVDNLERGHECGASRTNIWNGIRVCPAERLGRCQGEAPLTARMVCGAAALRHGRTSLADDRWTREQDQPGVGTEAACDRVAGDVRELNANGYLAADGGRSLREC